MPRPEVQELSLSIGRQGASACLGDASQSAAVGAVSSNIKVPPFYRQNCAVWFAQLEAQFTIARVSSSNLRYCHCLAALPEDVVLLLDLTGEPSYEDLKKQIRQAFEKSKALRLEEALNSLNISGLRPSIALAKLRRSFNDAGLVPDEELLRHRLLRTLPHSMQITLAAHQNLDLSIFAAIADTVWDITSSTPVCPVATEKSMRPGSGGKTSSDLTPFRQGQRSRICRSHIFYASEARTCKPWCKWPGAKPSLEPSSRPASRSSSPASHSSGNR